MTLALLVMTDGRAECIARTIPSAEANLVGVDNVMRVIHSDAGDPAYDRWLRREFPAFELVSTPGRSGFGGAIRSAWAHLLGLANVTHVFHLEDDFVFTRPVNVALMARLLDEHPHLAQMALRRQAWSPQEKAAGGFIEQNPGAYVERTDGWVWWLEHCLFFTTNPSLYRRDLMTVGWPDGDQSEGHFGFRLREVGLPWGVPGDEVRMAFLGSMADGRDWVWHIGDQRVGTGY